MDKTNGFESEFDANEGKAKDGIDNKLSLGMRRMNKTNVLPLQHGHGQAVILVDPHILTSSRKDGDVIFCVE